MKQKGKAKKAAKNKTESLKASSKHHFGSVQKVSSSSLLMDRLIMAGPSVL